MINRSQAVTCPFCFESKLHLHDMLLYFEDNRLFNKENYNDTNGNVIPQLELAFQPHNRTNGKFKLNWEAELKRRSQDKITKANTVEGGTGIVLNPEIFVRNGRNTGSNRYTIGDFTLTYDPSDPLATVINYETTGIAKPQALCCPHCECFFPLTFFDVDCYFIILAGESSVGKTMWLTALFRNGFRPLIGMPDKKKDWTLEVEFSAAFDGPSRGFKDGVRLFESHGIIPPATPNPIPPIFLTLAWSNAKNNKCYRHNLFIIDTMGETWASHNDNKQTIPVRFSDLADAIIYIIQPYQGNGYVRNDMNNEYFIPNSFEEYFENPSNLVLQGDDADRNDEEDEDDKRKDSKNYYDLYLSHFSNNRELRKKPCAFVISQIDVYKSEAFSGSTRDINYFDAIFSDIDATGKNDSSSVRRLLLDQEKMALHSIAAYHIVHHHFPKLTGAATTFRKSNFFAVSSFSGKKREGMFNRKTEKLIPLDQVTGKKQKEISTSSDYIKLSYIEEKQRNRAVNIHEPMMWVLLNLVGDRLCASSIQPSNNSDNELNDPPKTEKHPYREKHNQKETKNRRQSTSLPRPKKRIPDRSVPLLFENEPELTQFYSLQKDDSSPTETEIQTHFSRPSTKDDDIAPDVKREIFEPESIPIDSRTSNDTDDTDTTFFSRLLRSDPKEEFSQNSRKEREEKEDLEESILSLRDLTDVDEDKSTMAIPLPSGNHENS